jgi:HEAT repeat protein
MEVKGLYMRLSHVIIRVFKTASISAFFIVAVCSRKLIGEPLTPDNPGKVLRAHGVALTEYAVVAALGNKDIEVRRAASDLLMERWPKAAPSAIELAMSKEPEGFTRNWMARDLARLGDATGRQGLVKECHNTAEWGSIRIDAAGSLTEEFGDYACLDTIVDILGRDSDPKDTGVKEEALQLAPHLIVHLDRQEAHKIFELVISSLDDPWPGIRTNACIMLVEIGDPAAIPSLEAAISKEKDDSGRQIMADNLQNLKRKTQMQQRQQP